MRNKITRITKLKFLLCFKAAFNTLIIESNILGGFRGASLVPFNLGAVIARLKVQLCTLLLPTVDNST